MFRPSLALSVLTAMFASDLPTPTASAHVNSSNSRAQQVENINLNEDQRIIIEARMKLGNELRQL